MSNKLNQFNTVSMALSIKYWNRREKVLIRRSISNGTGILANWSLIVEDEQNAEARTEYGKKIFGRVDLARV